MSKEQEALRIIKSTKLYRAGKLVKDIGELRKEEIITLQELVDKHEKLREYLNEKVKEYESFENIDDYNGAYSDGALYVIRNILKKLDWSKDE